MTIQWFIVTSVVGILIGMAGIYAITLIGTLLLEREVVSQHAQEQRNEEPDSTEALRLMQHVKSLEEDLSSVLERVHKIEVANRKHNVDESELVVGTIREKVREVLEKPEPA